MQLLFYISSICLYLIIIVKCQYDIKVGMLIPRTTPELHRECGMYNSLGAIPIAIDRIVQEKLLENFNFTFHIYNDECDDALAAGYAAKMFEEDEVDVIFGPVCNSPSTIVGSMGKFYDKPIFLWGLVNLYSLTDITFQPTVSSIQSTSRDLGQAIIEFMKQYKYSQFAFIYSTNDVRNQCTYIKDDIETVLNNQTKIFISYQNAIGNTSLENIKNVLREISTKARIIVSCYESDYAKRTHLLALNDLQMNTDEYVSIFVELRGLGFGTRYTSGVEYADDLDAVSGTVPVWITGALYTNDGRDMDAKNGARTSFFIDVENSSDDNTKAFADEVMERAQSWPFYCQNCSGKYYNMSTYARYLHDSFYLYALALNRTLNSSNDTAAVKKGSEILLNTRGQFMGASGYVSIGVNGTRDPRIFVTGLRADFKSQVFMTIAFKDGNPTTYLNYTNPSTTVWEMRGGKQPLNVPLCGFDGKSCPVDFWENYAPYVIVAVVIVILIIAIIVSYAVYYRKQQIKQLNKLWKIQFIELDKPHKSKSGFQSERSLQSKHSGSTRMTLDSMTDSKSYSYFYFRREPVAARKFEVKIQLTSSDHEELRRLTQLDSDNCNRFIGLCLDGPQIYAVWKYCSRGSLKDVISKGSYNMDAFFVLSIMRDISNGLSFIHSQSFLGYHGRLTSKNCVVDDRWVVKVSDFGCNKIHSMEKKRRVEYLWMAPESMRLAFPTGTKPGDIYSFAIICSEVLTRKAPFDYENRLNGVDELLYLIKKGGTIPIRPDLSDVDIPDLNPAVLHLIRDCWNEEPQSRPNIGQVKTLMKSMSGKNLNLMDHIFSMVEEYAETLAGEVAERTKELMEEKKKSDILLYRMLPKQVADNLKLGKSVEPESFDSVTVFFSDVVQFTNLSSKCSPLQVVNFLNELYTLFDSYIETHDVYKVETIGDGYMCVSGLPHRNGNEHGREIANLSLVLMEAIRSFRIPHLPLERVNIRIGAHTGSCTAGVVGLTTPRYCLFGDTVNTASRMESNGKPGMIHISSELNRLLGLLGGYVTENRGEVIIKGKGVMETYWLISRVDTQLSTARIDQNYGFIRPSSPITNLNEITLNKTDRPKSNAMYQQFIDGNVIEFENIKSSNVITFVDA